MVNQVDERILVNLVRQNLVLLEAVTDPSEAVIMAALERTPSLAAARVRESQPNQDGRYIDRLGEKQLLTLIERNPAALLHVQGPSMALIGKALAVNGNVIEHLSSPSEEMKILAVTASPTAIAKIASPSEAVQRAYLASRKSCRNPNHRDPFFRAVRQHKTLIEDVQMAMVREGIGLRAVPTASDRVKMEAIRRSPGEVLNVATPTPAMRRAALKGIGRLLEFFADSANEGDKLAAVRQDGRAVRFIANPSADVCLAAVRQTGVALFDIPMRAWDQELITAAAIQDARVLARLSDGFVSLVARDVVAENPLALPFIKEPTEDMQMAAVRRNPWALRHVTDPSPAVLAAAVATTPEAQRRLATLIADMPLITDGPAC